MLAPLHKRKSEIGRPLQRTCSSTTVVAGELQEAPSAPLLSGSWHGGGRTWNDCPSAKTNRRQGSLNPAPAPQLSTTPAAASRDRLCPPAPLRLHAAHAARESTDPQIFERMSASPTVRTQGPCPCFGAAWADTAKPRRAETRRQVLPPLHRPPGTCIRTCWTRPEPPPDAPRTRQHTLPRSKKPVFPVRPSHPGNFLRQRTPTPLPPPLPRPSGIEPVRL